VSTERILYKEIDGKIVKIPLGKKPPRGLIDGDVPFKERMQKQLYQLEIEQGSRFRIPGYDAKTLKKVWCE